MVSIIMEGRLVGLIFLLTLAILLWYFTDKRTSEGYLPSMHWKRQSEEQSNKADQLWLHTASETALTPRLWLG